MSILQKIKQKAGRIIENQLLKTGRVLDVRIWDKAGLIEVDLYLPSVNMQEWNQVPYIKIQVAEFSFRDYTPFGWDVETSSCSILIDSAHQGAGSRWANTLQRGDTVYYLKTESTRQSPHPTDYVVGLGDASSIGHLLALQQLTQPVSRFDAVVLTENTTTGKLLGEHFSPAITTLPTAGELASWLVEQGHCINHTAFYLTGNQQMVIELRRVLKSLGHHAIRVKAFWS